MAERATRGRRRLYDQAGLTGVLLVAEKNKTA